ncbi:MAG: hypothetical protein QNK36_15110 [Colwellia sp.]|nr:hypothetical protein [Colwellia sp.]
MRFKNELLEEINKRDETFKSVVMDCTWCLGVIAVGAVLVIAFAFS